MKLSNRVRLIVIVVILVAALAVLFTIYSRQAAERNDLNGRLDRAQTLLTGLGAQKVALQDDLAQARSSLDTYLAKFPGVVESIEYGDDLFEIAADCSVHITALTASPSVDKKVGGVTYSVSSFVLTVSGATENMLKFVYAIRTGDGFQLPWSAEVNSINMNVGGGSANINLDIYGYKR